MLFLVASGLGLIVGTAFLLLRPDPEQPPAAQSSVQPSPELASQPPTPPAPSADSTPPPRIGRRTDLRRLARQVADLRSLPLRTALDARVVDADALAEKVSDIAFAEQDPEKIAATERLLVALRLAPADLDLAGIVEDLYREQILGLYVPEEETLYVRTRGTSSPAELLTAAHEITHALQDQSFDLVETQTEHEDDDDAALAVLSLIEGDAVLTQQLWGQEHLTAEELLAAAGESSGSDALDRAPDYLRESLFFPYTQGSQFVADLYRDGGYDAVDEAFADPPTSTEQILHPDRYRAGDEPQQVTIEVRPGPGWKRDATFEFGEFDLEQLLQTVSADAASEAAEGWGGGTIRSWSDGEGTAVAARLVFDTAEDAAQACTALPDWYVAVAGGRSTGEGTFTGDGDHFAFRCDGMAVDFALAPTSETARKLTAAP